MEYAPFERDARSRSSTWPLPDPNQVGTESPTGEAVAVKRETPECESPIPPAPKSEPKKMRNAWGNMSYAELITQAVLSSPDKRLTLSEIYDWIVQNVPYFADKANSPSTAGWKNSVRHNLSLHSRFVKVQNDSSGKSSWWTVNLDAKSGRTSRRNRSHSVDNGNTPSPKTPRKKKERGKVKKVKGGTSPSDLSPCDSPTTAQPLLQPPWSPLPSCPSPAPSGSDLSPCYSPVLQSPVLQRSSRNVTPVSPLVSPPALDQQGASIFGGSSSSLLDDTHHHDGSLDSSALDMFAQMNLSTRREGMGSSSSLSSLNSPRFAPMTKSPHPVFTFNNPPIDSSGYSSSTCFSDTDNPDSLIATTMASTHPSTVLPVPPPTYEEYVAHNPATPPPHPPPPHRPTCFTPTRSGTHPLQISIAATDPNRPRSGSEPAPVNLSQRFPPDIDVDLFNSAGFAGCDVDSIIRTEMQYNNGDLDFQFDEQYSPSSIPSDPTLTSATLGPDHLRMQQYRAGTTW